MSKISIIFRALRPNHWLKNIIIFTPLVFARRLGDLNSIWLVLQSFVIFCLLASSVYIFNDICDREKDAEHPRKRLRPIASGELSIHWAIAVCSLLFVTSLSWSAYLNTGLFHILIVYGILQVAYSLWFRRVVILDVIAIAVGFVLRINAGASVLLVPVSHWLLSSAFLLALLLIFSKRYQELAVLGDGKENHRKTLELYDAEILKGLMLLSATSALVSYMLYTGDPMTAARFGTDYLVYTDFLVAFGILRFLYRVYRCEIPDNPLEVIFHDRYLMLTVFLWGMTVLYLIF